MVFSDRLPVQSTSHLATAADYNPSDGSWRAGPWAGLSMSERFAIGRKLYNPSDAKTWTPEHMPTPEEYTQAKQKETAQRREMIKLGGYDHSTTRAGKLITREIVHQPEDVTDGSSLMIGMVLLGGYLMLK
jgi:hypothetical protein